MEGYPFADAPPPRYAIESDDEDEYSTLPLPARLDQRVAEVDVEFKSIHNIPSRGPLVFASGEAGSSWAKIIDLGEQQAGIYVNNHPVGLLFLPSWTSAVIIVSEIETRRQLPLFAMAIYTTAIIDRLQPTSVAILDSYPSQVYISPQVVSRESAPVRYLSLGQKPILVGDREHIYSDPELELFAPPNLLRSTTASLLNELFLRSIGEDPTRGASARVAVLLPSTKVPPSPPATFGSKGIAGDFSDANWHRETVTKAHRWLFEIVGEVVSESSLRVSAESEVGPPVSAGTTRIAFGEVGEGGMYI